jgi:subfamily B ATP-binding cassette protein HlyB/CyaB
VTQEHAATDAGSPLEDTGLASLAIIGRFHGVPIDPNQLRHDFAKNRERFSAADLVLAARRLGLKAKECKSDWANLGRLTMWTAARE